MTTPSVKFSSDGLIALNQAELAYLQSYLDAGDRARRVTSCNMIF